MTASSVVRRLAIQRVVDFFGSSLASLTRGDRLRVVETSGQTSLSGALSTGELYHTFGTHASRPSSSCSTSARSLRAPVSSLRLPVGVRGSPTARPDHLQRAPRAPSGRRASCSLIDTSGFRNSRAAIVHWSPGPQPATRRAHLKKMP